MNIQIIAGILLIAVGTWLTYRGANTDSRKDFEEVQAKIEGVRSEIHAAKAAASGGEAHRLDALDSELTSWASDFEKNRPKLAMAREQELLKEKARAFEADLPAHEVLQSAISTLRGLLIAYDRNNPNQIKINVPDLPADIATAVKGWRGEVSFGEEVTWELAVSSGPGREYDMLVIVRPRAEPESRNMVLVTAEFRDDSGEPTVRTGVVGDYFRPKSRLIVETVRKAQSEKPLREMLKALVELQLLTLNSRQ